MLNTCFGYRGVKKVTKQNSHTQKHERGRCAETQIRCIKSNIKRVCAAKDSSVIRYTVDEYPARIEETVGGYM